MLLPLLKSCHFMTTGMGAVCRWGILWRVDARVWMRGTFVVAVGLSTCTEALVACWCVEMARKGVHSLEFDVRVS